MSDVVAVASGTPFVSGCVFPVLCFRFWTAAASSAFCAFSRRRLCASCPVSGVPLAPSLPVLACAPAALAAVLRAVRAGFIGSPRHLTRLPMRRRAARAPLSLPQSEQGAAHSAFAPCERREVCGLPKQSFEVNAPQGGAGFPVLERPPLFAPLALTRCGRLARSLCQRRRWSGEARKRARFRPSRLCQAQPHHYGKEAKSRQSVKVEPPVGRLLCKP